MGANVSLIWPEGYLLAARLDQGSIFPLPLRDSVTPMIQNHMLCSWQVEGVWICSTWHDQLTSIPYVGKSLLWLLDKRWVTRKTYGHQKDKRDFTSWMWGVHTVCHNSCEFRAQASPYEETSGLNWNRVICCFKATAAELLLGHRLGLCCSTVTQHVLQCGVLFSWLDIFFKSQQHWCRSSYTATIW